MEKALPRFAEKSLSGGPERDRTADLCVANAALSQLSYRPVMFFPTSPRDILHYTITGRRCLEVSLEKIAAAVWYLHCYFSPPMTARGSRASRTPSPTKFHAKTVTKMKNPGINSHG